MYKWNRCRDAVDTSSYICVLPFNRLFALVIDRVFSVDDFRRFCFVPMFRLTPAATASCDSISFMLLLINIQIRCNLNYRISPKKWRWGQRNVYAPIDERKTGSLILFQWKIFSIFFLLSLFRSMTVTFISFSLRILRLFLLLLFLECSFSVCYILSLFYFVLFESLGVII